MTVGDQVRWTTKEGTRFGILEGLGPKWAQVRQAGRVRRVPREDLRVRQYAPDPDGGPAIVIETGEPLAYSRRRR